MPMSHPNRVPFTAKFVWPHSQIYYTRESLWTLFWVAA